MKGSAGQTGIFQQKTGKSANIIQSKAGPGELLLQQLVIGDHGNICIRIGRKTFPGSFSADADPGEVFVFIALHQDQVHVLQAGNVFLERPGPLFQNDRFGGGADGEFQAYSA